MATPSRRTTRAQTASQEESSAKKTPARLIAIKAPKRKAVEVEQENDDRMETDDNFDFQSEPEDEENYEVPTPRTKKRKTEDEDKENEPTKRSAKKRIIAKAATKKKRIY